MLGVYMKCKMLLDLLVVGVLERSVEGVEPPCGNRNLCILVFKLFCCLCCCLAFMASKTTSFQMQQSGTTILAILCSCSTNCSVQRFSCCTCSVCVLCIMCRVTSSLESIMQTLIYLVQCHTIRSNLC